jgi:hypothetical protein
MFLQKAVWRRAEPPASHSSRACRIGRAGFARESVIAASIDIANFHSIFAVLAFRPPLGCSGTGWLFQPL